LALCCQTWAKSHAVWHHDTPHLLLPDPFMSSSGSNEWCLNGPAAPWCQSVILLSLFWAAVGGKLGTLLPNLSKIPLCCFQTLSCPHLDPLSDVWMGQQLLAANLSVLLSLLSCSVDRKFGTLLPNLSKIPLCLASWHPVKLKPICCYCMA
jgi:hypothetical protein